MPFPIDLQKIMARTRILVKNSDFFTNGLILVIHIIYHLLVMIWKLLHHLKHPTVQLNNYTPVQLNVETDFKLSGQQSTVLHLNNNKTEQLYN